MKNRMEKKSRTLVKHEAENLQRLGESIVNFSKDQIEGMSIPGKLKEAVIAAKSMKKFGARRRQLQYIGSIMRDTDTDAVIEAVKKISMGRDIAVRKFKKLENWRDNLVCGPDCFVEKFIQLYPAADRQHLRILIRNAKKEIKNNLSSKSSRSLFKYIRKIMETQRL